MPYCNQCGTQVQPTDRFCAKCGGAQPAHAAAATGDPLAGVNSKTASLLCYIPVVGWIWAIVVLASARYRQDSEARFHAFQGLYLFVAWLLVDWVIGPMFGWSVHDFGLRVVPKLLKMGVLFAWVFMIIKTSHGQTYRLPIVGELADRSVYEQRS